MSVDFRGHVPAKIISKLRLAFNHLNVPFGKILIVKYFSAVLRADTLKINSASDRSAALIASEFIETSLSLMIECMLEAGASIEAVNRLHNETLSEYVPRSRVWEQAVNHLLP